MGVGPIPWTAIGQYAELLGLDNDATEALYYHVEHLDAAFLKWSSKSSNVGKN